MRIDSDRCTVRLPAIGIHIQSRDVGSIHHPEEGPEISGESRPENIFVFSDLVVREARIPARTALKLKPVNSGTRASAGKTRFI